MSMPWRQSELDTLRALAWQGLSVAEIASRLGRSVSAVRGERMRLGIHTCGRPGPRRRGDVVTVRPWSSMAPHEQASVWLGMEAMS